MYKIVWTTYDCDGLCINHHCEDNEFIDYLNELVKVKDVIIVSVTRYKEVNYEG